MEGITVIKCVTVGDSAVGKSCLLVSYITNAFIGEHVPTIYENYTVKVSVAGKPVLLDLWDTAGQGAFDRVRPLSFLNTDIIILCFSLVSHSSFKNALEKWHPEMRHYCPTAPIILVGTKQDLRDDETGQNIFQSKSPNEFPITFSQGMWLQEKIKAFKYVECSALTQKGLKHTFHEVIRTALNQPKVKERHHNKCNIL